MPREALSHEEIFKRYKSQRVKMQKDIDLNRHNIMNLFTLIGFVLKKKPLLVFTLFLIFAVLSSLILSMYVYSKELIFVSYKYR